MDVTSFYKSFMKVSDTLNKFKADKFNFSKGVFSTYDDGIMTVITFNEKIEREIIELFPFKFDIYPTVFKFTEKHLRIQKINFLDNEIEFLYKCENNKAMYEDKNFSKVMDHISKEGNLYRIKIDIGETELYKKIISILNSLKEMNFDESKEFNIDIYKEINSSEIPIVIDDDRFYVRLSKSTFQNVAKGDVASVKCIPYKDEKSLVFLTVTTVNKSDYQILNIFNALYL